MFLESRVHPLFPLKKVVLFLFSFQSRPPFSDGCLQLKKKRKRYEEDVVLFEGAKTKSQESRNSSNKTATHIRFEDSDDDVEEQEPGEIESGKKENEEVPTFEHERSQSFSAFVEEKKSLEADFGFVEERDKELIAKNMRTYAVGGLRKYWYQRHRLFSLFDRGILMDKG